MPVAVTPPRPGIAERLSRMIQLPTVSAEAEQRGFGPFQGFIDLLRELYPRVHEHLELEMFTDRGLLYRWKSQNPDAAPLVLMAHFDVVPVDETDDWTFPPFEGRVHDGFVYGRGALDDKGPLVVIIEAVENLLAAGFTPPRDVYLSFGGDEEVYGGAARAASAAFRERGIVPWMVLDEGGAVVDAPLPFLTGTAAMVGVAEKGVMTLRLSARSEGGHASAPPPRTAVGRIARAVSRLEAGMFRAQTPETVTRLLTVLGARATGIGRPLYRVLAASPRLTARVLTLVGGEAAAMVRTTVAPTMQSGGTAANVLPSQATATINLRVAIGSSVDKTVKRVRRRIADAGVTVELLEGDEPSPESPNDGPEFGLIASAVAASYPHAVTVPYIVFAATDSRHFHRFSPAVYRFAPLAMSAAQRASIHGIDERVEISALECGERFHRTLIEQLQ